MITLEFATMSPEELAYGAYAGRKFWETTPYTDLPYDEATVYDLLATMVEQQMLVLVKEGGRIVGGAGGTIGPIFFNRHTRVGYECFWWIEPAFRGQGMLLLRALERAAEEAGCTHWLMMALEDDSVEQVDVLYRRRGYQRVERGYLKRLCHGHSRTKAHGFGPGELDEKATEDRPAAD
jgi:GNAT superfamily N-acetyltransferase